MDYNHLHGPKVKIIIDYSGKIDYFATKFDYNRSFSMEPQRCDNIHAMQTGGCFYLSRPVFGKKNPPVTLVPAIFLVYFKPFLGIRVFQASLFSCGINNF